MQIKETGPSKRSAAEFRDVTKDGVETSNMVFASVSAILASAQAANSGHDTVIADAAHDTLTLKGVPIAQLQADARDFHLV